MVHRSTRVKNIMEMYEDTEEKAIHHIKHSDEARGAYYRNVSGQTWGNPHNYHLCLDASVGREKCAEYIVEYCRGKSEESL